MMSKVALALAAAAAVCAAAPPMMARRHFHEAREVTLGTALAPEDLPPAQWFNQTLDHFDATNAGTYLQRYYVNDTFFAASIAAGNPNPPVFLYIGGEGAQSAADIVYGHMPEMAAQAGALMIAIEHRYFGASVPTETLSTHDLRFLSSQQALADITTFHAYAVQRWNLTGPWISFGGSYPGSLSAFLRTKFPHVVYGAVASSAPVHGVVNMEAYNDVCASSIAATIVGGSDDCLASVRSGFSMVNSMLANDTGREKLQALFNTCTPLVGAADDDVASFVSDLSGSWQGVIQYNGEIPGSPTVATQCAVMKAARDPLVGLAEIANASYAGKCMDILFADAYAMYNNTVVDRNATGVGIRQWTWLTCTAWGYYQTCDDWNAPANGSTANGFRCPWMTNTQTLASNLELCSSLFGVSAQEVSARVAFSNDWFGGPAAAGSRIVYVDGNIDPWSGVGSLAIRDPKAADGIYTVVVPSGAHCANMQGTMPDDPPDLTVAREKIAAEVYSWIADWNAENALGEQ